MKYDAELLVGALLLGIVGLLGYFSIQLGQVDLGAARYPLYADFTTAGGLQDGAVVELAGVEIGRVERVRLADYLARVTLKIDENVLLHTDTQAAIKTKGLIGERYVEITPGHAAATLAPGGTIDNTEEPVDIQELIGEFIFGNVGAGGSEPAASQTTEEPGTDIWSLDLE